MKSSGQSHRQTKTHSVVISHSEGGPSLMWWRKTPSLPVYITLVGTNSLLFWNILQSYSSSANQSSKGGWTEVRQEIWGKGTVTTTWRNPQRFVKIREGRRAGVCFLEANIPFIHSNSPHRPWREQRKNSLANHTLTNLPVECFSFG